MKTNTLSRFMNLSLSQRLILVAGFTLSGFFLCGATASAATINVTAGADDVTVNGNCSIHEAVEAARTDAGVDNCSAGSGADTINLPDGVYDLSPASVNLDFGHESLTINGASRDGAIIDGTGGYGMQYGGGSGAISITLSNLTVRNSAGIKSSNETEADLTITNTVWHNNVTSGSNGIIHVNGDLSSTLEISDTIMRDNVGFLILATSSNGFNDGVFTNLDIYNNAHASGNSDSLIRIRANNSIQANNIEYYDNEGGPDFYAQDIVTHDINYYGQTGGAFSLTPDPQFGAATVTAYNIALFDNTGIGALVISSDAGGYEVDLSNITIEGNTLSYPGLFMMSDETTPLAGTIANMTIANNNRTGNFGMTIPAGMGIMSLSGITPTVVVSNVLYANNLDEGTPQNCVPATPPFDSWVSGGGNLSDDATCAGINGEPSDINNVAANIDDLVQDGSTWVVPLLENSPAVDAGVTVAGLTEDQRGVARPQNASFDIGAFEYDGESTPDPDPDPAPDPAPSDQAGTGSGAGTSQTDSQLAKTGINLLIGSSIALGMIAIAVTTWKISRGRMNVGYRLNR